MKIPVFRAGDATGTTTVQYSISPGTTGDPAEPADFVASPGTLMFGSNVRAQVITFSIVNDRLAEEPETVDVSLSDPVNGTIEGPTTMTLTILDNEENIDPVTKWHHPRQGLTYSYNDYRLREMHVFGKDEGGSAIVRIEMALRKRFKNGSCAWWTPGSGFVRGACSSKVWMDMIDGGPGLGNWPYFYLKRFPRLTPSIGTKVKNYTAWCRAADGAGNVESTFVRGRNLSTFEVARRS